MFTSWVVFCLSVCLKDILSFYFARIRVHNVCCLYVERMVYTFIFVLRWMWFDAYCFAFVYFTLLLLCLNYFFFSFAFFFAFSLLLPRSFLFLSLPVCIFTCLYLRVNCVRFRVIWCNASNPVDMMLLRLNHIARFSFHKCFYLAMHLIVWSGF